MSDGIFRKNAAIKILLVEDNPADARLLRERLAEVTTAQFELTLVERLSDAVQRLSEESFDVALLDMMLPDSAGLDILLRAQEQAPSVAMIMLTGAFEDEALAVKAVKEGAQDYLFKDQVDGTLLVRSIRYAIERKQVQEALKASREYARNIIESSLDMIIAVDNNGIITEFNKAAEETFGYRREEIIGQHVDILYADPEKGRTVSKTTIEKGRNVQEILNKRKNGELFQTLLSASVLLDSHGELVGVMGVSRDITELKKTEEALVKAKERAEVSDRLKNIFLSTISHEVRTPLNVILGYIDLLSTELTGKVSNELWSMFATIQESGEQLKRLIDDVLDVSHIEADQMALDLKSYLADEIVQNCVTKITIAARKKKLDVVEEYKAPQAVVNVDKLRLQQVIGNILQNAMKFTHKGSITVTTGVEDGQYHVAIKDTGIGIREDFKPYLFTLFRQAEEGYSRRYEGAGLGLAISQRLISAMEGRIEVRSGPEEGSTFALYLPAKKVSRPKEKKRKAPKKEPPSPETLEPGKKTVLILEDNAPNLKYLEFLLKRLRFNTLSAKSGEQALDKLKSTTVHCMLADVSLAEGMSGIEFMKRIRRQRKFKKVPIIATTAHAMKGQKKEYLEQGFDDYLGKPFTLEDLKKVLYRNLLADRED